VCNPKIKLHASVTVQNHSDIACRYSPWYTLVAKQHCRAPQMLGPVVGSGCLVGVRDTRIFDWSAPDFAVSAPDGL